MKTEEFDEVIETNVRGTYLCIRKAARTMLKQKYGRIINISSVVGVRGNVGQVNYSASKAAIIGMTKSLAKELAAKKITVNAVAPGMIETEMSSAMTDAAKSAFLETIPQKRMGTAKEVADAVAFFAREEAAYVTGQVLCVDGGMAV
jgi:3-oxoacyl-[acyl-carrier protein] reductase